MGCVDANWPDEADPSLEVSRTMGVGQKSHGSLGQGAAARMFAFHLGCLSTAVFFSACSFSGCAVLCWFVLSKRVSSDSDLDALWEMLVCLTHACTHTRTHTCMHACARTHTHSLSLSLSVQTIWMHDAFVDL